MPTNTPRLGLPKGLGPDNASGYLKGSISGGGLWRALEILDDAVLQSSVNSFDDVTLTSPNIGADQWTDANHTHASAATAGSTLGPGTTLSTPTLQTPAVSGVMTFGGDATLTRTGPGALRADTHLGVGVTPAGWAATWPALQVAQGGAVWGSTGSADTILSNNVRFDGTDRRALVTGPGGEVTLSADGWFKVRSLPSVAAGAVQTFTERLQLAPTGTLTLTPDAGQAGLAVGGVGINLTDPAARIATSGNLGLAPSTGYFYPTTDNFVNNGHPSIRWTTVYAVSGPISTSSREFKEGITPLDPARAMEAVRNTPAVTFDYMAPARGPEWYDLPDDPEQAEAVLQQRLTGGAPGGGGAATSTASSPRSVTPFSWSGRARPPRQLDRSAPRGAPEP